MTTTGVKNAGSVQNSFTASVASTVSGQASGASFQSVLDSQAGKSDQTVVDNSAQKTDVQDTKPEDSLKGKDAVDAKEEKGEVKESTDADATREVKSDEDAVSDPEEAMEVLMTAVAQIVDVITETFNISKDELNTILDEMGLTSVDLLDGQTLGEVILEVGGAQDSFELLTNEELYQNFNSVMETLDTVLEADSGVKDLTVGELKAALDAQPFVQQTEAPEENPEPKIEIAVEEEPVIEKPDGAVSKDAYGSGAEAMQERANQSRSVAEQTGRDAEEKSSEEHSKEGSQSGNLFLQNLKNDSLSAVAESVEQTTSKEAADSQDIMRQIMDYMKIQIKPDQSNLEMQLHPESLGTLRIHLVSNGGVVTANFVTQNEAVRAALESQMIQLKDSFAEQGIKVEAIEVTVETHQFEQNLEQGQGNGRNADSEAAGTGRTARTRRLRLEGMLSAEELDAMEPDDRIAVEMMKANGTTVDYTA